jgi:hypothetical protein
MLHTIKTEEGIPEREEIEQVRRLLFGEMQEANRQRMDALEANLNETRALLERQIAALGSAASASQANVIREIGVAISSLGQQIAGLVDGGAPQTAAGAASSPPTAAGAAPTTPAAMSASEIGFVHSNSEATETANASSAATGAQDHE